jgi:hypothetical protein
VHRRTPGGRVNVEKVAVLEDDRVHRHGRFILAHKMMSRYQAAAGEISDPLPGTPTELLDGQQACSGGNP